VNALYCLINFYDMATVFLSFRMFMTEQTDGPLADNGEVVRASLCSSNRAGISTADLASATLESPQKPVTSTPLATDLHMKRL
jgi:hypothetical protein